MAWYGGGFDDYRPYVSVVHKKAYGMLALAKLLKKSKRKAEPVVIAGRKRQLATTFWGRAWCDNLDRYADFANRLPRGRAYLRNGSVLDLAIAAGRDRSLRGRHRAVPGDDRHRPSREDALAPGGRALHRPDRLPRRAAAR